MVDNEVGLKTKCKSTVVVGASPSKHFSNYKVVQTDWVIFK